jgi:membrane-associated phospholipid phosphatase
MLLYIKMYEDIIDYYGDYIPYVLLLLNIYLLRNETETNILIYYIVGFFINNYINIILKNYIKDERPYWNIKSKYNMPSGHSQSTFYSIAFIFIYLYKNKLLNSNILLVLFYLTNGFITIRNCIVYNYHTKDQIFYGGLLGSILGITNYLLTKLK